MLSATSAVAPTTPTSTVGGAGAGIGSGAIVTDLTGSRAQDRIIAITTGVSTISRVLPPPLPQHRRPGGRPVFTPTSPAATAAAGTSATSPTPAAPPAIEVVMPKLSSVGNPLNAARILAFNNSFDDYLNNNLENLNGENFQAVYDELLRLASLVEVKKKYC